jgi:3'-phosphoadenosine 5'-phosphosulfate sulfotransferase (PAPS reductase)/FAD synthetase
MTPIAHARRVMEELNTDSVIVMFSGGKDSIVLFDLCVKTFKRVAPVYMYFVPGMEHVETKLRQFELRYGFEIMHLPHWAVSHYHANGYMKLGLGDGNLDIPKLRITDVENLARQRTGIDWVTDGIRITDGLARRARLKSYRLNAICDVSKRAHPLAEWKKDDIATYIRRYRLPKPLDYGGKAVSGVDISKDSLQVIRDKWPSDYRKIISAFPLADSVLVETNGED